MKKMKRILAVILTAVFAFLMLTACSDGGAEPAKNDYGKMIESAMNAARREYRLPDVKFEASLESCAKNEANHSVNASGNAPTMQYETCPLLTLVQRPIYVRSLSATP